MNGEFSKLAKYGTTGICIALILLIAFIVNIFVGIMSNHIDANTDAFEQLKISIDRLDQTISKPQVQANLYSIMNDKPMMDIKFPYEYDPSIAP